MKRQVIIDYWMDKARADLESAKGNFDSGRHSNAIRDAYFACFHAFSSLLFKEGRTFRRHKDVRSALHRDFIRSNRIDVLWGKHYDWLFDSRQKADYRPMVQFDAEQVRDILDKSGEFIAAMKQMAEEK
ncbi:MAG: HEPN domain-containing protein [Desulfobacteraceae bacterium]|nr:MAG: HEPN domain-containing protein [Desulfobacteraceae bacterium]